MPIHFGDGDYSCDNLLDSKYQLQVERTELKEAREHELRVHDLENDRLNVIAIIVALVWIPLMVVVMLIGGCAINGYYVGRGLEACDQGWRLPHEDSR